ncbi:MAG TPA: benzoate-CoA ligase family protein [Thermoanaerobaculia bacterium]|nr:benzoate-CoA ligase family protein [Thermoanaerobaculia bacterium]
MAEPRFEIPERFNLTQYLLDRRLQEGRGDHLALRVDQPDGSTRGWTYTEVAEVANRAGNALARLGVEPEQRVIVALSDSAEFVAVLFGALKIGAVVVMVNPKLSAGELSRLCEYIRPKAAVVASDAVPAYSQAQAETRFPRLLVAAHGPAGPAYQLENELASSSVELEAETTHRDDAAIWLFSGGTTGRPKAVIQSHASFANTTELYARCALGYRAEDVTLAVPKLFFGYATGSNLFFPFSVGATAVLFPEHPSAEVIFAKIRRHRPSILINVPTLVNQMVQHPAASSEDLSSLRFATSAGEALPVELYHRFRDTFGVELLDGLGTAEMWHIFVSNLPGAVKPGTLGRVVPGFEVSIRNEEGVELGADEVGRMWVRGGSLAQGYWREKARTEEAFRGEWFVGGDLASRDAEGYISYHGRGDEVLKVAGRWLAPAEVESCLLGHSAVRECAVVGVPDGAGLIKPQAYVVTDQPTPELADELKAFALARLDAYKHPREIVFVPSLPRTHLGKVDRGKLRGGRG